MSVVNTTGWEQKGRSQRRVDYRGSRNPSTLLLKSIKPTAPKNTVPFPFLCCINPLHVSRGKLFCKWERLHSASQVICEPKADGVLWWDSECWEDPLFLEVSIHSPWRKCAAKTPCVITACKRHPRAQRKCAGTTERNRKMSLGTREKESWKTLTAIFIGDRSCTDNSFSNLYELQISSFKVLSSPDSSIMIMSELSVICLTSPLQSFWRRRAVFPG